MLKKWFLVLHCFLLAALPGVGNSADIQTLASECYLISQHLFDLKAVQTGASCTYKLNMAGHYTRVAGDNLIKEDFNTVKEYIRDALEFLRYAEKMNCEKMSEITQAKWDLVKVIQQVYEL